MNEPQGMKIESDYLKTLRVMALGLLAFATILLVIEGVVRHWSSFSAVRKFSAAVLLFGVILNPIQEMWAVKQGVSDTRRLGAAVSWNTTLMIAALLFMTP